MTVFDTKIENVLAEYHARMESEAILMNSLPIAEGMKRRDDFLLSVGPEVGYFLNTLVKSAKSKTILEVGTSYGYSTLFLAEAAKSTHGKVISLEIDAKKVSYAKTQLTNAGLLDFVEFRIGDALTSIKNAEENFDFVLIDIWKELYVPSFELIYPKLSKGAWVLGDNMIHPPMHKKEALAYRSCVKQTNAFDTLLLPIGSGIEVSHLTTKNV